AIPALSVGDTFSRGCPGTPISVLIPISRGHSAAAHQNLAVFRQLHLAPRQHFADRSFAQPERMVHADQRSRLGQTVALNHGIAHAIPEFFGLGIEGRAARNERPEFPAEAAADRAKNPPAPQKMFAFRTAEAVAEIADRSFALQVPLDFLFSDCSTRGTLTSTETRSRR